jgi:hypothetical protein
MRRRIWLLGVCPSFFRGDMVLIEVTGMSLRWDFFVNAYDTHRYLPAAGLDGRENRHIAFVREFASVVSVLQVRPYRQSFDFF